MQKSFTQSMALRVLLADESATIKKVFQLALQDYAVEVRSVNVGTDVSEVAKSFQPDILFADVLLQKKSGYDVCAELKQDSELSSLPVVLMWSGFMELDEDKFQAAKADGRLEKPFDVGALRKQIQELVPKTNSQQMSQYLTFPKMPEFDEAEGEPKAQPTSSKQTSLSLENYQEASDRDKETLAEASTHWDMEAFDPIENFTSEKAPAGEEFQQVPLPLTPSPETDHNPPPLTTSEIDQDLLTDDPGDAEWVQQDLERFRVGSGEEAIELENEDPHVEYQIPEKSPPSQDSFVMGPGLTAQEIQTPPPLGRASSPTREEEIELEPEVLTPQVGQPTSVNIDHVDSSASIKSEPSLESTTSSNAAPPTDNIEKVITPKLSEEELEEIIRRQSKEVIESVVWKVVPELASQIIQKELNRLLAEKEQLRP